ncbi:hypothetical protein NQD34_016237 [Periophthalmus magnuspinnatus]|nr:hypothetical protein NQD34_016237 [Periophthalmus magnuspinnatus]
MYPETAEYVANYILRKPSLSLYEPLYVRRYWRSELPNFSTPHQGRGGYWWSPQRYQDVGTTWRDTHRHRVVLPGNTGFSDVPSSLTAGYCRRRPTLVWTYRWQKLRERVPQVLKRRQ